jgi:hypothetical protein
VNLEICTLFKGVPTGFAIIHYVDPKETMKSFKGIGIFNKGKLHNAPFICYNDNGIGYQYIQMQNGRPAENSYLTYFKPKNSLQNTDSLEIKTDVSGW